MDRSAERETVGILAAWGRLPVAVAEAMRADGYRVCCLGIRHHADEAALREASDEFAWVGVAQLGRAIRQLRRRGVRRATLAGKFHKVELYRPGVWWRHRPDLTTVRAFYEHFLTNRADRKDDTLLERVCRTFAKGGVTMEPATDFAPRLLVSEGHLAGPTPTAAQRADIAFGWELAKQMGGLDVGQSVCVQGRAPLAVEAIEGTDLCIQRAGELSRRGGFTVVKVAKPNQDMRFDVPTIGVKTLRTMARAGAAVLAVEADRTILLDAEEFRREAKSLRIAVVAQRGEARVAVA